MDIKQSLDYRYKNLHKFDKSGILKYDYEKNGILKRVLPKILFRGNPILVTFLQLIDLRCILLFKYIDKIKKFKHFMDL